MPRKKVTSAVLERPQVKSTFRSIEDILAKQNAPVEQKKIAYELMAIMGGEKGFVEKLIDEFNATEKGSLVHHRFFELMLKLMDKVQPKESMGAMDYITDEDIARVLREHISHSEIKLGYPTHFCI